MCITHQASAGNIDTMARITLLGIVTRSIHCDSLLLLDLLGGLCDLARTGFFLRDALDNSNSNGLSHVTYGKATKGRVLSEALHTQGLLGQHLNNGSISRFNHLGVVF